MNTMLLVLLLLVQAAPAEEAGPAWPPPPPAIQKHLGRPYVWGTSGLKSFDCSGFIWRVLLENGVLTKRTTARKFYMSLPRVSSPDEDYSYSTVVFFDNLKHVGLVKDKFSFYHAQTSAGTNLSRFDPYWRRKVVGFRAVRRPSTQPRAPDTKR